MANETKERNYYEFQQQGENGNWYRSYTSEMIEGENDEIVLAELKKKVNSVFENERNLDWITPEELRRHSKPYRFVRVKRLSMVLESEKL